MKLRLIAVAAMVMVSPVLRAGEAEAQATPVKIRRVKVESTNLASVGYSVKTRILEIRFESGPVYRFSEVPRSVYKELMKAESKGKYFHDRIDGKYPSEKVSK